MTLHSIQHLEASFLGHDGTRLFRQSWLSPKADRVIVLVHGLAEHSGRYSDFSEWFTEQNFSVHAYDHRGHGRSSGHRGHVRDFDELLDDLQIFLDTVKGEHPGQLLTLIGHSMGGLIVLAFLCQRDPKINFAVSSGPALRLADGIPKPHLIATRLLGKFLPKLSVPNSIDGDDLSNDPEVGRKYKEDPLVHKKISLSLARAILEQGPRTSEMGTRVQVPLLIVHGEADRLCPVQGSQDFMKSVDVAGSELKTYSGLQHEVFNEPERESVYQDVLTWIEEREGKR